MKTYPLIEFFPMGGPTKEAEYNRTIQILKQQTGANDRDLMLALYLMADCGYNNKDLYTMAKLIQARQKQKQNLV